MTPIIRCLVLCATILPGPAIASSEDAWEVFRAAVETACRAQVAAPDASIVEVEVNPFGSEHFGAAIVEVRTDDAEVERSICIYDKQTGVAELTAPFADLAS